MRARPLVGRLTSSRFSQYRRLLREPQKKVDVFFTRVRGRSRGECDEEKDPVAAPARITFLDAAPAPTGDEGAVLRTEPVTNCRPA